MRKIKDGGPAFPATQKSFLRQTDGTFTETILDAHPGMTLRDWFAGMAFAHLDISAGQDDVVVNAYGIADAMIAEREK